MFKGYCIVVVIIGCAIVSRSFVLDDTGHWAETLVFSCSCPNAQEELYFPSALLYHLDRLAPDRDIQLGIVHL